MRIKGKGKNDTLIGSSGSDAIDGVLATIRSLAVPEPTISPGVAERTPSLFATIRNMTSSLTSTPPKETGSSSISEARPTRRSIQGSSRTVFRSIPWGHLFVGCVDVNGDGVMDTQLSIDGDNVFVLGCMPNQLYGWAVMGG